MNAALDSNVLLLLRRFSMIQCELTLLQSIVLAMMRHSFMLLLLSNGHACVNQIFDPGGHWLSTLVGEQLPDIV